LRHRSVDAPATAALAGLCALWALGLLARRVTEPDFAGAELLIEDVSEHLYRIDRTMFHVTGSPNVRNVRQLRLGRISDVVPNDVVFVSDGEAIVRDWCARSGIPFGGVADIAHDAANRVVPFGSSPI
jgi:muramoyltetrapeptide carboxypeptidase